ncbi:hypothetical protein F4779DRAFT_444600 [Xylariaceae sp. FL0662B]|nr:hypothetical protein F4779DRAFT_444600 [Xylariaceae sp. FL0662B]
MTREKKKAPAPTRGVQALARRAKMERAQQYTDRIWRNLNPLKEPPKMKHKTYFESVENTDRKKKLEFQITTDRHPPPGFEFIPTGHPELSQLCKELSREQDAMIFIVSDSKNPENLEHHMNRAGYHFRQMIVDQARSQLMKSGHSDRAARTHPGGPEPIPQSQADINREADAVLRDLFPRIPNTDRHEIIQHAFQKGGKFNGEYKVGMAKELTLARRVQLAALAHIRHTHTRYDELLKESDWANARKAVEKPCLDIIVKWRGDEETGRDQLDEILREVIEISDTEEDSENETSSADDAVVQRVSARPAALPAVHQSAAQGRRRDPSIPGIPTQARQKVITRAERRTARKTQQRFRRYAAAAEALAGSSYQNGDANGSGPIPLVSAAPTESVRRSGSARTVQFGRDPLLVAHRTPNSEQIPGDFELQRASPRFISGLQSERSSIMHHGPPEAYIRAPSRLVQIPDSHGPKVGPPPASHSRSSNPLSPVRREFQDLLVQSIEPASPVASREPQVAPVVVYRNSRQSTEATRVVTQSDYEPAVSARRPRSPGDLSGGETAMKRRRVATYSRDHVAPSSSSFFRISHQGQEEDLRRAPLRYFADSPVAPSRTVIDPPSQYRLHPISGEALPYNHDVLPPRTRAGPAMIDGNTPCRPHRLVEVRRPPNYESYDMLPVRRDGVREFPPRGDPHIQDTSRVVYIDPQHARAPEAFDSHHNITHPELEQASYQASPSYRLPPREPYRRVLVDSLDYQSNHSGEIPRNHQVVRNPIERSGNMPREVRVVPSGIHRVEEPYRGTTDGFQEFSSFAPTSHARHDCQKNHFYTPIESSQARPPRMEYWHDQQPSHHMTHRPPLPYHAQERRDVVWVDR